MRTFFAALLVLVPLLSSAAAAGPATLDVDLTELEGDVMLVANDTISPRPDTDIVRYRARLEGGDIVQTIDLAAPIPANDTFFAFTIQRNASRIPTIDALPLNLEYEGARAVNRGTVDFAANATVEGSTFTLRFPVSKLGPSSDCFQVRLVVTHDPESVSGQGWRDEFQIQPNLCDLSNRLDGINGTCPAAPDLSKVETDAQDEDARGDVTRSRVVIDSPGDDIVRVSTKRLDDRIEVRMTFAGPSEEGGQVEIGLDLKEDAQFDGYDQRILVNFDAFRGYVARGTFYTTTSVTDFPVRIEQWGDELVGSFCSSVLPASITCWGLGGTAQSGNAEPFDQIERDDDCVDPGSASDATPPTGEAAPTGSPSPTEGGASADTPGLAPMALIGALAALALWRRR